MTGDDVRAGSLSLRTRIGQVNQRLKGWEAVRWVDGAPRVTDVLRREVDRWGGLGALYGVLRADPWSRVRWADGVPPERSAEAYAAVQEHVDAFGDGIPVLFVEEAPHGLMALGGTTFPVNLALGAGMDPELTERLAAAVAAETRSRGAHVALVSGLDVLRDPRWGRAEECFSEDPALAALLMAATVRGMQGTGSTDDPIDGGHVAVVAKHLAGQGAGIGGRNGSGAPIGGRELGEIHLRPAHAAARLGVAGYMAAYNDIDGIPCSANRALLTGTIRERWGWDGVVMADGTAVDRLRDSAPDPAAAATLALEAGVDLSLWDDAFQHIEQALDRGLLAEDTLNRAVDRVLALKRRLGLLGSGGHDAPGSAAVPAVRDVVELSRRAAAQAVVLVSDSGALPLRAGETVAVVGPNADDLDAQLGDYTPPRPAPDAESSSVLSALAARFGTEQVRSARGSGLWEQRAQADALDEVRSACEGADVAVVVLGGSSRRRYEDEFADNGAVDAPAPDTTNGEGVDLASVAIPGAQLDVLRAACAAAGRVIGVIVDGRPRVLTAVAELVDALLVVPFPGPHGGDAIADALTGAAVGGGRLPATFPAADGVMPVAHDERRETARGYVDADLGRTLAFGTAATGVELAVREETAEVSAASLGDGASARVTVDARNRTAAEVDVAVPVYGDRQELGVRPRRRQLLAVRRIVVPAGATASVDFDLGLDELGSWATGEPRAVPATVRVWTEPHRAAPERTARVRVTDETGRTPWER